MSDLWTPDDHKTVEQTLPWGMRGGDLADRLLAALTPRVEQLMQEAWEIGRSGGYKPRRGSILR